MGIGVRVEPFWPQRRHFIACTRGFFSTVILDTRQLPGQFRSSMVSSRYSLCLGRSISHSKVLVSALPHCWTLVSRLFSLLCTYAT